MRIWHGGLSAPAKVPSVLCCFFMELGRESRLTVRPQSLCAVKALIGLFDSVMRQQACQKAGVKVRRWWLLLQRSPADCRQVLESVPLGFTALQVLERSVLCRTRS